MFSDQTSLVWALSHKLLRRVTKNWNSGPEVPSRARSTLRRQYLQGLSRSAPEAGHVGVVVQKQGSLEIGWHLTVCYSAQSEAFLSFNFLAQVGRVEGTSGSQASLIAWEQMQPCTAPGLLSIPPSHTPLAKLRKQEWLHTWTSPNPLHVTFDHPSSPPGWPACSFTVTSPWCLRFASFPIVNCQIHFQTYLRNSPDTEMASVE